MASNKSKIIIDYTRLTFQQMFYKLIDDFLDNGVSEFDILEVLTDSIIAMREGWE